MKKYSIAALALVLTALTLTGCRKTNMNTEPSTVPTTNATTAPATMPSTDAPLAPTESTQTATEESNPGTIPGDADSGSTDSTENSDSSSATDAGRARRMPRTH